MESKTNSTRLPGERVAGGYVIMTVTQVLLTWHLYLVGQLQLRDVRLWLALFELQARRRFTEKGRKPRYRFRELVALAGRAKGTRASLRRLQALGLVSRTTDGLTLAVSPEEVKVDDLNSFWERFALVPERAARIPLPRRVLRFMAGGTTRVETACILAHAIRCLFMKEGGLVASSGVCKGSWVEDVFEVNASRIRDARSRLTALGLLKSQETHQLVMNRWGARVTFNLQWADKSAGVGEGVAEAANAPAGHQMQHPPTPKVPDFATPNKETSDLPTEGKNQTPVDAPQTPTGVSRTEGETRKRKPETHGGGSRPLPEPSLRHVLDSDLRSTERLLVLHAEAATRGLAPTGERGELELLGLAEHARRYATRNPPGLFARLLHEQRWSFITQDDEDLARARLREFRDEAEQDSHGGSSEARARSQPIPVGELLQRAGKGPLEAAGTPSAEAKGVAADAQFVRSLRRMLASKGLRDSEVVFRELTRAKPEWTRERWVRANCSVA